MRHERFMHACARVHLHVCALKHSSEHTHAHKRVPCPCVRLRATRSHALIRERNNRLCNGIMICARLRCGLPTLPCRNCAPSYARKRQMMEWWHETVLAGLTVRRRSPGLATLLCWPAALNPGPLSQPVNTPDPRTHADL